MKVLFVCRGNVGRSQMAEFIFNDMAPGGMTASSVGTRVKKKDGTSAEGAILGEQTYGVEVLDALKQSDLDASKAVREQLIEEMISDYDVIVNMAEKETVPDYLANSEKVRHWEIEDPKGKSLEDTVAIRDEIKELVQKLIIELS